MGNQVGKFPDGRDFMSQLPVLSINFSDCPIHLEDFFLKILNRRYRLYREDRPEFLIYALTGQQNLKYLLLKPIGFINR
jgi:hypothetical protein